MIYILTSFFDDLEWCEIQEKFLDKNLEFSYHRIGIIESNENIEDYSIKHLEVYENKNRVDDKRGNVGGGEEQNDHFNKLDKLKNYVLTFAEDNDIVLFLDSDCFPIKKLDNIFFKPLETHDSISIKRRKVKGKKNPSLEPIKPIFSAFYVKTLRNKKLNWGKNWPKGFEKLNNYELKETGGPCHNGLQFCIYGYKIYHHGMGSRYEKFKLVDKNEEILNLIRDDLEFHEKLNTNETKNKNNK